MFLKIRTKNGSASPLRGCIPSPCRAVLRLGSTTPTEEIFPREARNGARIVEINKPQGCIVSGNKISMKQAFDEHQVKTAEWMILSTKQAWMTFAERKGIKSFPVIVKHKNSSQGNGIHFAKTEEELSALCDRLARNAGQYIIEKYYTYTKEYRLHVTRFGCFYACRKMIRENTPDDQRWHRHDNNSVWILEENASFAKPANWDDIVAECQKALEAVGLDVCACDVKVSKDKNGRAEFIILETNSAPALGGVGIEKYKEELPLLIQLL